MAPPVLSELLSAAYVAFTIEADNLAEQRISHRTTDHGEAALDGRRTVWLASVTMSLNCLRWLPPDGVTIAELRRLARTPTNLDGVRRWGYVTIDGSGKRPASRRYRPEAIIALSRRGLAAQKVFAESIAVTEERWRARFRAEAIDGLRDALLAITTEIDLMLPDCLPILGYGLHSLHRDDPPPSEWPRRPESDRAADRELSLLSLLARALLALAIAYEDGAKIALAIQADVLGPIGADTVALRDLPARAGVSREGIDMALTFLTRTELAELEPLPGKARGKQVRLTERGRAARQAGAERLERVHREFAQRHGKATVATLSSALTPIVGDATAEGSPLFAGLEPAPDTWRAELKAPLCLPRFPLVLHRGGFPDGA